MDTLSELSSGILSLRSRRPNVLAFVPSVLVGQQEWFDVYDLAMVRNFSAAVFQEDVFFGILNIEMILSRVFGRWGDAMRIFQIIYCSMTTASRTCNRSVPEVC